MALAATMVFEVRTTGSDTQCAGGFNSARGGTDYSQQDTAQATGTVTSATTAVTSTTGIFTSAMVGNMITDGTTFKEITAFTSSTVVTVDSAPSWTAATIYVGGALSSAGKAAGIATVGGNTIFQKNGAYSITSSSSNVASGVVSLSNTVYWVGYSTNRAFGNTDTKPVNKASGISSATMASVGSGAMCENIEIDGNSLASMKGFSCSSTGGVMYRCNAKNFTNIAFDCGANAVRATFCYASGCATSGPVYKMNSGISEYCISENNSGLTGFAGASVGCISNGNAIGFDNTLPGNKIGCIARGNSSHGFDYSNGFGYVNGGFFMNCISYGNGGWGFSTGGSGNPASKSIQLIGCAFGSNTSGNVQTSPTQIGCVTLSGDPFVNAASGNFALNSTAGAGAACRGAGIPGAFPGGLTTGYVDIGAAQHQDSGGGGIRLVDFAGGFA